MAQLNANRDIRGPEKVPQNLTRCYVSDWLTSQEIATAGKTSAELRAHSRCSAARMQWAKDHGLTWSDATDLGLWNWNDTPSWED